MRVFIAESTRSESCQPRADELREGICGKLPILNIPTTRRKKNVMMSSRRRLLTLLSWVCMDRINLPQPQPPLRYSLIKCDM